VMKCQIEIPAGVESYDAVNLKAALSLFGGVVFANATGISDTFGSGTL